MESLVLDTRGPLKQTNHSTELLFHLARMPAMQIAVPRKISYAAIRAA
jgi:hypothetical protein